LRRHRWLSPIATALAVVIGIVLMSLADGGPGSLIPPERVFHFGASAPVHHQGEGNALTPQNLNPPRRTSKHVVAPPSAPPSPTPSRTPTTELLVAAHPVTATPPTTVAPTETVASANSDGALEIVAALVRILDQLTVPQGSTKSAHVHAAHRRHRPHHAHQPHDPHVTRLKMSAIQKLAPSKGQGRKSAASDS
jgi:hypothetical protein